MATARIQRRKHNPFESLERMLNRTTLTTQRVSHSHIVELGNELLNRETVVIGTDKDQAVADSLKEAEQRFKEELAAAKKELCNQLQKEKEQVLLHQKQCYESRTAKAFEQWQKAEAEKMRLLKKEYDKLSEEALKAQSDTFEDLKERAVSEACKELEQKMRKAFAFEREQAVADALGKARKNFREREEEIVQQTQAKCKKEMNEEITKLTAQHEMEMKPVVAKHNFILEKFNELVEHNRRVEADFLELQRDYMRFLDNTGGRFHSDYMIDPHSYTSIVKDSASIISFVRDPFKNAINETTAEGSGAWQ